MPVRPLLTHIHNFVPFLIFASTWLLRLFVSQAKSQFKSRSIANNVEIIIPVPNDVDSPTFKASSGSVAYLPDQVSYGNVGWTIGGGVNA